MVKIVAIALVSAIIIVYLKSINSELALLATIASGIIIIFFSLEFIVEIINDTNDDYTASELQSLFGITQEIN
mgnify:CR=1 FL=1